MSKPLSLNSYSYFEIIDGVLRYAMQDYRRLYAVRADVRFPKEMPANQIPGNEVMGRFVKSLRSKVKYQRDRVRTKYGRAHATDVRVVWVREFGPESKRPHYHLMLVFNRDAYRSLGDYKSDDDNLSRCIQGAWTSALKVDFEMHKWLVSFSRNGQYEIINGHGYRQALEAMQYLCKEYSKVRDGARNIGYSLARKDLLTHGYSIQCVH